MHDSRTVVLWTGAALVCLALACEPETLPTAPLSRDLTWSQPAAPSYTSIDFPGADKTALFGINGAGDIVGDFTFSTGGQIHGFRLSGGAYIRIDVPNSTFTRPEAINDSGAIVGVYQADNSATKKIHGFLLTGGSFSAIDFPGANETMAMGIDNHEDIVGGYCTGSDTCYPDGQNVHGFLLTGGAFSTIDFPGAIFTELAGIAGGAILGRYAGPDGVFHLFVLKNGEFSSIDFPGATETPPFFFRAKAGGLNQNGEIASYYCSAPVCSLSSGTIHAFIVSGGGTPLSFDFPGATETFAADVNANGAVVGLYFAPDGRDHGFLRTP